MRVPRVATPERWWPDRDSDAAYNLDASAIAEFLASNDYPLPAWLASGRTACGDDWSLQELVDGQPMGELDVDCAGMVIDLVERQRSLRFRPR